MAVTLQLKMVDDGFLEECADSTAALMKLVSSVPGPESGQLDLNWAPAGLVIYAKISSQKLEFCRGLDLALDGRDLVNPGCRAGLAEGRVYSDITKLNRAEVVEVVSLLKLIDRQAFKNCLPLDQQEACAVLKVDLNCHPNEFYLPRMEELLGFYDKAASARMNVVMWWD